MAFRLDAGESMPSAIRRLARTQLDDAIAGLGDGSRADGVHDARRAVKRVRAVLRLARPALTDSAFRRANEALRDAGRSLAPARDAQVLAKTFSKVVQESNDPSVYDQFGGSVRFPDAASGAGVSDAIRRLDEIRAGLDSWPLDHGSWRDFERGLREVYSRGRSRWRRAEAEPSAERLHEWRKAVKQLWHALELLSPVWPATIDAVADQTHDLSDLLGDDHDLAMLGRHLETAQGTIPAPSGLPGLLASQRSTLQAGARSLGRRIYAEKPSAFSRRHSAYLSEWLADAEPRATG